METTPIEVETVMNECLTISFKNNAHNPPTYQVLVCQTQAVFEIQKARLTGMSHIEVLHAGLSRLVTE